MTSMLELLMERTGETKVPRYAKETFGFRGRVAASAEFKRIKQITRRVWCAQAIEEIRQAVQSEFAKDQLMDLWPVQALAIAEACMYKGGLFPIGVGRGKALISLLVPVALEAKRPLLIVPAQLREQTKNHVIPEMRKHFTLHPRLRIIGYSELSLEKNAKLLEEINPDLIVCDEVHRLRNPRAGRTRRMRRYMKEHPETMFVAMSGTISSRSIKDYAHVAEWALKGRCPLPMNWQELSDWADAIDAKVDEGRRVAPGALQEFCVGEENVRQGYRRRLVETPGVVATSDDELGTSLNIRAYDGLKIPSEVGRHIQHMRDCWETPNGDLIAEAVRLWRHVRQMALGYWGRWDPPGPRDWMDARKEWKSAVREKLKHSRELDTELQVHNWCRQQLESGVRDTDLTLSWHSWLRIKDTFKPNPVPEWISDYAAYECLQWAARIAASGKKGIIWVEHVPFGKKLTDVGLPYFGAGDNSIIDTKEPIIVASISAHGEGKNLQHRYSENLVTSPPTSGKVWEQLLGRTHRPGQEADEVNVEIFLHVDELRASFDQARSDAVYLEDTTGGRQKLNYANIVL